jgi:hypothetical protein
VSSSCRVLSFKSASSANLLYFFLSHKVASTTARQHTARQHCSSANGIPTSRDLLTLHRTGQRRSFQHPAQRFVGAVAQENRVSQPFPQRNTALSQSHHQQRLNRSTTAYPCRLRACEARTIVAPPRGQRAPASATAPFFSAKDRPGADNGPARVQERRPWAK